jgi:hypothetical protein
MKIKVLVVLAIVGVAGFVLLTPYNHVVHDANFKTRLRYSKISDAIQHFAWDHDNVPSRLSELIPRYVNGEQISIFYPPQQLPVGWSNNPELVDSTSDCVYVGSSGISREVVAYQRTKETNRPDENPVLVIPAMGGVVSVSPLQLDNLLHSTDSDILERFREERVQYYQCDLHGSLNVYREKFGAYPLGNNADVSRALRGNNPAKEQFPFNFTIQRTASGEDLDPWGTPYFLRSDGYTVQMKSAGRNRKFDTLTSSNYDDTCFTITNGAISGSDTRF